VDSILAASTLCLLHCAELALLNCLQCAKLACENDAELKVLFQYEMMYKQWDGE
jgi:hypothetical protein